MRILITAGPTREAIDPVRFLSNRSSGKMGYALARVAVRRGHVVTLISGPVALRPPPKVSFVAVTTADEMLAAVKRYLSQCDALIMAAAVADWRPRRVSAQKIKKATGYRLLCLEPTPDILKQLRSKKGRRVFIGFAAETERLLTGARRKLAEKGLDLVVANDVSRRDAGFEVDTNRVTLLEAGGGVRVLPLMTKMKVAARILDWLEAPARRGCASGAAGGRVGA
ncbi:MAG: phosphopantothenoylcysteine decarboxylase [Verrucomicrobia bacterium]|nr:phosphopantothenoylcysteine decarboxylase [Verrucomicrobiota bacterium]MBU1736434.1 phosphopantothenoylcysteine decarboxylase [Verrucomicrobiota bacterium]MBU1857194.1 phosphopantothenoylcysteine decarboxylase [Verrucomicrobiota bacterium]